MSEVMEREDDLVTTADIARMAGLTREYVTDVVSKKPTFPKPKINMSRKTRKWLRRDILKWMAG